VLLANNQEVLAYVIGGLLIGAVLVSAVGLVRDRYYAILIARILRDIRAKLFVHLHNLSMGFFSQAKSGDLLGHFSTDLTMVESAIAGGVTSLILPALDVFASCILLFFIDWRLAIVSMLVWPMALLGPRYFAPKVSMVSNQLQQTKAATLGIIQEDLSAQPVIKVFNLADDIIAKFKAQNEQQTDVLARVGFFSSMVERSANIGILFLQVVLVGIGALMVSKQLLTIGSLAAFQTLFASLSYSLSEVTRYLPRLVEANCGIQRIEKILSEVPALDERKDGKALDNVDGELTFRDVSFGYEKDRMNLSNIDLVIEPGKSVAFVGPSGSGKSTVLSLAMRSYDPVQGSVLMGGIDLRESSLASLRNQLAVVFQESFLFDLPVRDNIRIGKKDATQEEIEAAARAAGIHETIMKMPAGYDTMAGEKGKNFSGGQRQRLAIARAILRNPRILILDEATSALDPSTEASINETLLQLSKSRTTLSVTHRLSSVVNCDRIYYLEDGKILEHGSYQDLMAQNGRFRDLWEKQHGFSFSENGNASVSIERMLAIPIFSVLDRPVLEDCVQMFTTETAPPDRIVTAEGDIGSSMYIIVRGKVEVFKRNDAGKEIVLTTLSDGDYFGEISLLRSVPRTASVRTLAHCVFMTIQNQHFLELVKHSPELLKKLEETVESRLKRDKEIMRS
ncbi:MAG: ABC transporter transmembrane domain-containing protein, partial [Candidatus Riflebacteria bacterium]|nr:ABC transporter transmembrane domain-containing protein [Candidatus Riflebacteria bacterium]